MDGVVESVVIFKGIVIEPKPNSGERSVVIKPRLSIERNIIWEHLSVAHERRKIIESGTDGFVGVAEMVQIKLFE